MGGWVCLELGLGKSFGCGNMCKKFQGKWVPLSCTFFSMPPCCIQTLGIFEWSLASPLELKIGIGSLYVHKSLHKKFHQQWIRINDTSVTKCHSAPTDI